MSLDRAQDPEFFSSYVSMLRTNSMIGELVDHKREINQQQQIQSKAQQTASTIKQKKKLPQQRRKTICDAERNRLSKLFNKTLTDEQRKAIGMSRVNRQSNRLTRASMTNGSNAALLENRFFQSKSPLKGAQLTTTSNFVTAIEQQQQSQQSFGHQQLQTLGSTSRPLLKLDQSAQQIGGLGDMNVHFQQYESTSPLLSPATRRMKEHAPSVTHLTQLRGVASSNLDTMYQTVWATPQLVKKSDKNLYMTQNSFQPGSFPQISNQTAKKHSFPSIASIKSPQQQSRFMQTDFSRTSPSFQDQMEDNLRRDSLPDMNSTSQFGEGLISPTLTFDQNGSLKLKRKNNKYDVSQAFSSRSRSVLVVDGTNTEPASPKVVTERNMSRSTLFQFGQATPTRNNSTVSDIQRFASIATKQNAFVSRLSDKMQHKHDRVQKRVTKGVLSRIKKKAELDARVELDSDEELQQKWQQRLVEAEAAIERAMRSVDQNNKIDYAFDITRQLTMAYKKKLGDSSGHVLDQIYDQRSEVRTNVKALDKQIDHSVRHPPQRTFRPWAEPRFEDFHRDHLREERARRIQETAEKKKTKALQLKGEDFERSPEVIDLQSTGVAQLAEQKLQMVQPTIAVASPVAIKHQQPPVISKIIKKGSITTAVRNDKGVKQGTTSQSKAPVSKGVLIMKAQIIPSQPSIEVSEVTPTLIPARASSSRSSSQNNDDINGPSETNGLTPKGQKSELLEIIQTKTQIGRKTPTKSTKKSSQQLKQKKTGSLNEDLPQSSQGHQQKRISVVQQIVSSNINEQFRQMLHGMNINGGNIINLDFKRKGVRQAHESDTSSIVTDENSSDGGSLATESYNSENGSYKGSAEADSLQLSHVSFSQNNIRRTQHEQQKEIMDGQFERESEGHKELKVDEQDNEETKKPLALKWQASYVDKQKNLALRPKTLDVALQHYHTDNEAIAKFFKFCQSPYIDSINKDEDESIEAYPILHQLFHGRLILINCDFGDAWCKLIKLVVDVLKQKVIHMPLTMVYFENCTISDRDFSVIIDALGQSTRLREIHIVRMTIRPITKKILLLLCKKNRADLSIFFRESLFVDIYRSGQSHQFWHPFLSTFLVPIRHLTLIKSGLRDKHLDLVVSRLNALQYCDISFNEFKPDSLHNFLLSINRCSNQDLKLRTLNLAGNSLRTSSERTLAQTLSELLLKPAFVHMDLSMTDLGEDVVSKLARALRYARTLQSLHISSTNLSQATTFRTIVKQQLGPFAFFQSPHKDIVEQTEDSGQALPQDWNIVRKLPDPHFDQLGSKLVESITESPEKQHQVHKVVLSRILGRPRDLSLLLNLKEAEYEDHRKVELATLMDEEQQLEILDGLSCVQDYAWLVSDRCWICERWSYYLPLVTKQEIEACHDDLPLPQSILTKLSPSQERVFDALIKLNGGAQKFKDLDIGVPYIVGAMTNYKFEKMDPFGEFMLSIDPDATQIKQKHNKRLNSVDTHAIYCESWQKVLKSSSQRIGNIQPKSDLKKKHKVEKNNTSASYTVAPYEVITERPNDESFAKFALVWLKSLLVPPGPISYFIYYRFDEKSDFCGQVNSQLPLRPLNTHYYSLPMSRNLPAELVVQSKAQGSQQRKKDEVIDRFFTVFKNWRSFSDDKANKFLLSSDSDHWQMLRVHPRIIAICADNSSPRSNSNLWQDLDQKKRRIQVEIDKIVNEILDHQPLLDQVFRQLQSTSGIYPQLKWEKITQFIDNIDFLDETFTLIQFKLGFIDTVSTDKKQTSNLRKSMKKIDQSPTSSLKAQFTSTFEKKMELKRQKEQNQLEPNNVFSRLHFYEFLARISLEKYAFTAPAEAFKRLVQEHLRPAMKLKELGQAVEPHQILENLFFSNMRVKQLLFLNQFSLKTIYDELAGTDPANEPGIILRSMTMDVSSKSRVMQQKNTQSKTDQLDTDGFTNRVEAMLSSVMQEGNAKKSPTSRRSTLQKASTIDEQKLKDTMTSFKQEPQTVDVKKRKTFQGRKHTNSSTGANASGMTSKACSEDKSKLSYCHLRKSVAKALGPEFKRVFTDELFKKCYAWAKIQTPLIPSNLLQSNTAATQKLKRIPTKDFSTDGEMATPRNRNNTLQPSIVTMLEAHAKQAQRVTFIETCIFFCLLSWQLYDLPSPFTRRKVFDLAEAQESAYQALSALLGNVLSAYGQKIQFDIDDQTWAIMMSDFQQAEIAKKANKKHKKQREDNDSDIVERAYDDYMQELEEMTAEDSEQLYHND